MKAKVVCIHEKEEIIAHSLGMTLKEFRDRKALLMRQVEQVKGAKKHAKAQ